MKLILLFTGMVLMGTCEPKQAVNTLSITQFEYLATTRGSSFSCTVTSKGAQIASKGMEQYDKYKLITNQQWLELLKLSNDIALDRLDELKAPSSKSETDRSRIAKLTIRKKDKNFESNSFDEGNPPVVLRPLINYILTLAETVD
jgi:hypothetical protein